MFIFTILIIDIILYFLCPERHDDYKIWYLLPFSGYYLMYKKLTRMKR